MRIHCFSKSTNFNGTFWRVDGVGSGAHRSQTQNFLNSEGRHKAMLALQRNQQWLALFPLLMIGRDEALVPEAAVFGDAALCGVIDIDNAETLAVAFSPLKVIEQ
jgi:hypothetical protein